VGSWVGTDKEALLHYETPEAATHPHMKNVQLNCNISVFPASYTSSPFFNSTLV